jgi:hypothetical protein
VTFIPTQTGFMRLEDSEKLLRDISQTIPAWRRTIPRHVGTDSPGEQGLLERREDVSLLVSLFV